MELVVVRGGGDLATGVVQKLHRAGFAVLILETDMPTAIRRTVSLCEAVYDGMAIVEDIICRHVKNYQEIYQCFQQKEVPLLIDPTGTIIDKVAPIVLVDCIIAKKNLGTNIKMAPVTVGVGPGFCAGEDVQVVVETMRGHNLGRLIFSGYAEENTGIPGEICGKSTERVMHAPVAGKIRHIHKIGDVVPKDRIIFYVGDTPVMAPFSGLIRGMIREGLTVMQGMKMADIDPRTDVDCHTISDKARNIGGAVLEAVLYCKIAKR